MCIFSSLKMMRKPYSKIPPPSFGAIIVSVGEDQQHRVLLQQRRDSYAYTGFLCGDYDTEDQIPKYFNLMTQEEKDRLQWYYSDFDRLWRDLFINVSYRNFRRIYPYAREMYERIKHQVPFYVELSDSSTELHWSFPKGRLKKHGDKFKTIIDEVEEETRVRISKQDFVPGIEFTRTITGSDDRTYEYTYYLAHVDYPIEIPETYVDTPDGTRKTTFTHETIDARWFTFDEAREVVDESICELLNEVELFELFPVDFFDDLPDVVELMDG